jgi:hypothetical protein
LRGTAALGSNYIRSGIGNIESSENTGNPYGENENTIHAVQGVFGKSFGRFSFGFAMRLMYEFLDNREFNYSGSGVSLDLGVLYILNDNLSFGLTVKDINGKLESNTQDIFEQGQSLSNRFPVSYKAGIAWTVKPEWGSVYYDFETNSSQNIKHHLGIETARLKDAISLRLGLENERFTAGFGFSFTAFDYKSEINYVYLPSVIDEGDSHAFAWVFSF